MQFTPWKKGTASPIRTFLRHLALTAALCLTLASGGLSRAAVNFTVKWAPNSETDLAGYRVYHGTASKSYSTTIDLSLNDLADPNAPQYTFQDLPDGVTHYFAVTAYNDANTESAYSDEVSGTNRLPEVTASATPSQGAVPLDVTFTGSATDEDGIIERYAWDFGDGNASSVQSPTHTFNLPGKYVVRLTVTDNDGASATASIEIRVTSRDPSDQPPSVRQINGKPAAGSPPLVVRFWAQASDPDGEVVSYLWDLGDESTSGVQSFTHTYTAEGEYVVTLTVTDDDGATGISEPLTITVGKGIPPRQGLKVSTSP